MSREEILRVELAALRREHRDLDEAIEALDATGRADLLTVRRLKKRRLWLRDRIRRLERELFPDEPA
ncbi:MAG: DUF465 domain-containing protein [Alphaproteobacteria bacterium]|nr:MAG: DUF465 domain-containing protein [Alphaproteobacteria bacterium]